MSNETQNSDILEIAEIKKMLECKDDLVEWAQNYIILPNTSQPIVLNHEQKNLLKIIQHNTNVDHYTPRQSGTTTFIAIYLIYQLLFSSDKKFVYLTSDRFTAKYVNEFIHFMISKLPTFMQTKYSNYVHTGPSNSKVIVTSNYNSLRGMSLNEVIVDDGYDIKSFDEMKKTIWPQCVSNSKFIVLSSKHTPNNNQNMLITYNFLNDPMQILL